MIDENSTPPKSTGPEASSLEPPAGTAAAGATVSTETKTEQTIEGEIKQTEVKVAATVSTWKQKLITIVHDINRVVPLILVGILFMVSSIPLAKAFDMPALASWGLFVGAVFWTAAISHVIRRILFPKIDLQAFAAKALESPYGAGMVFIGVCIVLAAFVSLTGSMFQVH